MTRKNKESLISLVWGLISIVLIISSSFVGDHLEKISFGNIVLIIGFVLYIAVLLFSVLWLRFQLVIKLVIAWCCVFIISHYLVFRVLFPNVIPDMETRPAVAFKESFGLLIGALLFSIGVTIFFVLLKKAVVAIKSRTHS